MYMGLIQLKDRCEYVLFLEHDVFWSIDLTPVMPQVSVAVCAVVAAFFNLMLRYVVCRTNYFFCKFL